MKIRVVLSGFQSPHYAQALYQGIAQQLTPEDSPVLVFVRPDQQHISIGLHQNIDLELNLSWCEQQKIPVIRRSVGGGTVLLDAGQLFFQFIFPDKLLPNRPNEIFTKLLTPVVATFKDLGCTQAQLVANDIQVNGKKICGTGAANIDSAKVVVGSFMSDFDYDTMTNCINAPSSDFQSCFSNLMQQRMTTLHEQLDSIPNDSEIIEKLCFHVKHYLGYNTEISTLTIAESQAIQEAITELNDEDWLHSASQKLIKNGIKIAANTYLLEKTFSLDSAITLRLLVANDCIEECWIKTTSLDAALENLAAKITQARPHTQHIAPLLGDEHANLHSCFEELLDFQPY